MATNPNGLGVPGYEQGSLAGLIPAVMPVAGLLDTVVSAGVQRRNVDRTIAAQKEQAELAYQRQLEFWHMQNQYNSPAAQMARFKAAGLNPHLIYGQGNPGNASDVVRYHPPDIQYRYQAPQVGGAIASVLPTLMQVGTWLQEMRKGELAIEQAERMNPLSVQRLQNLLELFPYQREQAGMINDRTAAQVADLLEEFRYRWGAEIEALPYGKYRYAPAGRGARQIELLQKIAQERYMSAQADWYDTNQIVRIVMSLLGIGGLSRMVSGSKVVPRSAGRAVPRATKIVERFDKYGRKVYRRVE